MSCRTKKQFQTYRDAALGMSGRPVTIRTLDLGADKADRTGLTLSNEENPALGLRGVRLSLARPKVADTQLRAILRASAYGKLRVLVPMVSTREELLACAARMLKLTEQLRGEGHMVSDHVPLGAMRSPRRCAGAGELHRSWSISCRSAPTIWCSTCWLPTATTRRWASCIHRCPAVLRLLQMVIETGARHRVPVAVCGEMAGDARMTRCCWRWA